LWEDFDYSDELELRNFNFKPLFGFVSFFCLLGILKPRAKNERAKHLLLLG